MTLPRFTSGSVGRLDFASVNSFFDRIDALKSKNNENARRSTPSGRIVTAKITSSMGESHAWVEVVRKSGSFVNKVDGLSSSDGSNAFAYPLIGSIDQTAEMTVIVAQYASNGDLFYIPLSNGPCACGGGGNCYFYNQCNGSTTARLSYQREETFTKLWGTEIIEELTTKIVVENVDMALILVPPEEYAWVSTGFGGTAKVTRSSFLKAGHDSYVAGFNMCEVTDSPPTGCLPFCQFCVFSSNEIEGDLTPVGPLEISITCFDPCFLPYFGDQREDWNVLNHRVQHNTSETYSRESANCNPDQVPESEFYEFRSFIDIPVRLIGGRGCMTPTTFSQVSDAQFIPNCTVLGQTGTLCEDNGWCAGFGRCELLPNEQRIYIPNRLPVSNRICYPAGTMDPHICIAYCPFYPHEIKRWVCEDVRPFFVTNDLSATVNFDFT